MTDYLGFSALGARSVLITPARPAYFFFKYSSIALRMSALTGTPVWSEIAFSLFR